MFVVQINLKRPKGSCKYIMLALGIQFIYLRHFKLFHVPSTHPPQKKIIHDNTVGILNKLANTRAVQ